MILLKYVIKQVVFILTFCFNNMYWTLFLGICGILIFDLVAEANKASLIAIAIVLLFLDALEEIKKAIVHESKVTQLHLQAFATTIAIIHAPNRKTKEANDEANLATSEVPSNQPTDFPLPIKETKGASHD